MSTSRPDHEVAIIGAGFAGIGTATALERAGIDDYVLLEQGDGVGGTWHWNTYPGVGVDIPSFSYQFSYAQRSDWSRVYAPGRELKAYAEDCVDSFGLRSRIRLETEVSEARFDTEQSLWRLAIADGSSLTARFLIAATGVFTKPKLPEIEGLDSFEGSLLHTGRWDSEVELRDKRVAIIGTGASAVQVIPTIAPEVERLTVFQRTPIWCLPKFDRKLAPRLRQAIERIPGAKPLARGISQTFVELNFPLPAHFAGVVPVPKAAERIGHRHLRRQVADPELRRKLTPSYGLGCKRPSFSNSYLPTFNRPNVELETDPITAIVPSGLETAEGRLHEADVLILATGFKVFDPDNMPPIPISGRGDTDLGDWWSANRFQAYEGVSVPGFPNYFMILGPYGFNGSSYFTLIENQARHIARCLRQARRRDATSVEVTPEANRRYFETMLSRRGRQIFFQGTCAGANSYYFDPHGDVPFRSATTFETIRNSHSFDLDDYRFE